MRLAKLSEYRRLYFTPDSAPSMNTLRKKFESIPGHIMLNGQRYIDLDEFERHAAVRSDHAAMQRERAKSPRLQGLI